MLEPPLQHQATHQRQCQRNLDDHGVPVARSANCVSPRRDAQNRLHLHPEEAGEKPETPAEQRRFDPSVPAAGQEASESSCPGELEAMEPLAETCGSQKLQSARLPRGSVVLALPSLF